MKLYTTDHMIRYNSNLFSLRKRTIPLLGAGYFRNYIEHNCSDGVYFLFRKRSKDDPEWAYVVKLKDQHYLQEVKNNQNALLFYAAPHLNIPKKMLTFKNYFTSIKLGTTLNDILFHIDSFTVENNKTLTVRGWGVVRGARVDHTKKYLVLKSKKDTFFIHTIAVTNRKDVTRVLRGEDLSSSGFEAKVYLDELPKGKYSIYLLLIDPVDNSQHMRLIEDSFIIKGEK